ncbi:helix-turn-helix domain-containing protein [Bradymonadaceae bacterium TMQ3]|uniref:Helix-turn-helix domain-containing protein n=1 Tax=Lujinxingia sediminis TaxID=2480984 RepID=A0ABY0CUB8_9DELT|nr:helix-turn-helix domain-containing protein [Lujinxingia sediminis]RDV38674.1 helix-turn-helix domain-containing protein [Bradymonadaceae bacterium TMQ3]RVU44774.1 helix-turn-helix domain-containing protein [Lujinxingia sediminis]TXC76553.1 helix-turn-helix domain-containing protein [Bradymonadales bacterium TMQ1]
MKSPGMMLREAREEQGLGLSDVATMTRIPRQMLEHLENDRFEEYVAEVFLRGHIRNYSRELGLDGEQVIQVYERFSGRKRQPLTIPEERRATPEPRAIPQAAPAASGAAAVASPSSFDVQRYFETLRPSHMVAVVLVLFGIFVMFSFLSTNRATAHDPTGFPQADESAWELEQDVEQTRWLLEQPGESR